MASQLDFKVPSWVPKSVRQAAPRLLDELLGQDREAGELFKRLTTHKNMRRVWTELTKQRRHRRTYKPAGPVYSQESVRRSPLLKSSYTVDHLVVFLHFACFFAIRPIPITTREEVLELRGDINDTTTKMEKLAVQLRRWQNNTFVREQFNTHVWASTPPAVDIFNPSGDLRLTHRWTDFNQLADELGKLARWFDFLTSIVRPEGPVVKRRTSHDDVRPYVLRLASVTKDYFSSPLYSVIATTASIALKKKISPTFVKRSLQRHT